MNVVYLPAPGAGLLTTREAAVRLGVRREHVTWLLRRGLLAGIRTADSSKSWLVDPASIDAYLARPRLAERRAERTRRPDELVDVVIHPYDGRPRFPLGKLRAASGGLSHSMLARSLGVDRTHLLRWRHTGMTEHLADRCAIRLGLHPCQVWGDDWWSTVVVDEFDASVRRHPAGDGLPPAA